MKKRTVFFLTVLLFSTSLAFSAVDDASLTLNAHVRGITVHGFVKPLPEDDPNDGLSILMEFLTGEDFDELGGPTVPMLRGEDLTLGYGDIADFDFGDSVYKEVANYLFLSNMTTAAKVTFTISDFVHDDEPSITVPWELGITVRGSQDLTISDGKKESGTTVYPIITTLDPLKVRWAILTLDLHFTSGLGYLSGDYTATVVASITAS